MMALYDWIGTSDQAAEYYKKYLDGLGMKFLGQQSRGGSSASTRPKSSRTARPRRVLVFHGPKRHLAVTMRQNPKNDRKVLITLNLVYPES